MDRAVVYMPYCSSDAFLGDMEPSEEVPWHFKGQRIVRATIDALIRSHGLGDDAARPAPTPLDMMPPPHSDMMSSFSLSRHSTLHNISQFC